MIRIVCFGEPVPQGRPRLTTVCGHPTAYDPAKSRSFKQYVRLEATRQMEGKDILTEALVVSVRVFRSIPKSFSKRKATLAGAHQLRPTVKPDLDNYIKSVVDGLTGVVWHDDNLIVSYERTGKFYTAGKPRVEVRVWTLDEIMQAQQAAAKETKTDEQ